MFSFPVCLDGSAPAYHLARGSGSGENSWLVHFEVSFFQLARRMVTICFKYFYMFSSTQCSSALNCCRVEDGATMSRPACNGSARGWGRPRRWRRRLPSPESSVIRRMTTQVLNFCGSWPMENLLSLYCYTAVSSSFYSNSGHLDL